MKKKILLLCIFLSGCNTMHGVGDDIQDAGMGIQNGVSDIRQTLHI